MKYVHRSLLLPLALAVAMATVVFGPSPAHAAQAQAPTDRLQVWNVNTKHMATNPANCTTSPCTDYREFAYYITDSARVTYVPDIVTLQEAGTDVPGLKTPSCQNFVSVLQSRTGLDYHCYEATERGGAAIVYRTGRLSYVGGSLRNVQLKSRTSAGADCTASSWYALALRLKDDKNAGKYVNAASVHLPYSPDNADADCAWENMKIISPAVGGLGSSSMQVMAGDWNHVDGVVSSGSVNWECWYEGTNVNLGTCGTTTANLGWKDVMYRACNTSGTAAYNCMNTNHWTKSNTRIDFLFAKAYAVYNTVTVDYALAYQSAGSPAAWPKKYSDHRGQGSLLRYY